MLLLVPLALANERHFTYTYDTEVLPMEAREIEPWTTIRPHDGMLEFDQRVEIELPVTNRLMTALYLNWSAGMHTAMEYQGISSEWKWNLLSRHTNPVGLALYGEVGLGPSEQELEAKVLVDRQSGPFLVAFNAVAEVEREGEMVNEEVVYTPEAVLEGDLAVAWLATPRFSVGVEARNHTEFPAGEGFEHSAFFVGPTLAWSGEGWWAAGTALPQVYAIQEEEGLVHDEHSAWEGRLLVGLSL